MQSGGINVSTLFCINICCTYKKTRIFKTFKLIYLDIYTMIFNFAVLIRIIIQYEVKK